MSKGRLLVIIVIILFISVFGYGIYFVATNTHFLNFNISDEDIDQNNLQVPKVDEEKYKFTSLVKKKLNVPDRFKDSVPAEKTLNIPEDFEISVFYAGFGGIRHFDFDEDDNLIAADIKAGKVFMIKDFDKDGIGDESIIIDESLRSIHSIEYFEGDLYSGEEDKIVVYKGLNELGEFREKKVLVSGLPTGGHRTRTVVIGPDRKMYVSVGSSCNVCLEENELRAAVLRYDLNGNFEKVFAKGLRNSVGMVFKGTDLWSVDNGRDRIGEDLPFEEVNVVREDKHYGWPYCHSDQESNPEFPDRLNFCLKETVRPIYKMQAHSAPLDLKFGPTDISNNAFPGNLEETLFVSFHGSWNRTVPTGYKIVRIDTNTEDSSVINFITGWLEEGGRVWGRPVGLGFDSNGRMFISDDHIGAIYIVRYLP